MFFLQNFKKKEKKQHEISLSLIISKIAIETRAQEMNWGPETNWGAKRAEQFPDVGNYTLTPARPVRKQLSIDNV